MTRLSDGGLGKIREKYVWHNKVKRCLCYMCVLLRHSDSLKEEVGKLTSCIRGKNREIFSKEALLKEKDREIERLMVLLDERFKMWSKRGDEVDALKQKVEELRYHLKSGLRRTDNARATVADLQAKLKEYEEAVSKAIDYMENISAGANQHNPVYKILKGVAEVKEGEIKYSYYCTRCHWRGQSYELSSPRGGMGHCPKCESIVRHGKKGE